MEYAKTEKGKKLLIRRGYEYIIDRKDEEKIIWKCRQWYKQRCRGRLHVSRQEDGKILKSTSHNHVPDCIKTEVSKEKTVLIERSQNVSEPTSQTAATFFSQLSQCALSEAPRIDTVRRTIRRQRQMSLKLPKLPKTLADLNLQVGIYFQLLLTIGPQYTSIIRMVHVCMCRNPLLSLCITRHFCSTTVGQLQVMGES